MESAEKSRRVLVTPDDLLGVEIDGRYKLESVIGGGGMGVVFNTTQPTLNKPLALKLLKFDDATDDRVLKRFERELEIVSQLSHPNIVNIIEAGRDTDTSLHFVVMERVDGVTLEEVISRYRMTADLALDIASQVCSALSEPHRQGVVHRDVKPANIMFSITSDGRVATKLLDFGIARTIDVDHDNRITTTSTVIGSPAYMAPEAASGTEVDPRTDLYSFGVVLYEMLVGDVPFRGSTPVAVMLRHAVDQPVPIDQRVPNFEYPELTELVSELLSKEPDDRPDNARAVLERIESIQRKYDLRNVRCKHIRETVVESLSGHLLSRIVDDQDAVDSEYGPTETFRGRESDPLNAFDGWMVPQPVAEKISGEIPKLASDSRTPVVPIVAGLLLGLVLISVFAWFNAAKPKEVIELSEPVEASEAVVTEEASPAIENPQVVTTPSKDAGRTDADDVQTAEKKPSVKKPIEKKTTKKQTPVEPENKEEDPNVGKGFEWIKNK